MNNENGETMKDEIIYGGKTNGAQKAIIMLHGRGSQANNILLLSEHLNAGDLLLAAPQAPGNTWYPYSFLAPVEENEPSLSEAIQIVGRTVEEIERRGIQSEHIYILGFSQGACLTLEYAARNARRYAGLIAFTGGLIGERIDRTRYKNNFSGTPVFIGTSDPDMHVPVIRVRESAGILKEMGAEVMMKIYPHMGHTISQDELKTVNELFFPPLTL
jgi:phospholipase/carboxylesterase